MQNQAAKWLDIRRDKPDFLMMYGWGAMNATAIKEAIKAGFPMDKFVSIWWPGDNDAAAGGRRRQGLQGAQLARHRAPTIPPSPTSRSSSSTRARARPRPANSARSSTTTASTIRC